MLFGADYYPEHWDTSRIEKDITLMKEAGINVVRMAEFAWSLLEPTEGVYEFEWLDNVYVLIIFTIFLIISCVGYHVAFPNNSVKILEVSECKDNEDNSRYDFEKTYIKCDYYQSENKLKISHFNATFNCCTSIRLKFSKTQNKLTILGLEAII